jgi:hypothetical protein
MRVLKGAREYSCALSELSVRLIVNELRFVPVLSRQTLGVHSLGRVFTRILTAPEVMQGPIKVEAPDLWGQLIKSYRIPSTARVSVIDPLAKCA